MHRTYTTQFARVPQPSKVGMLRSGRKELGTSFLGDVDYNSPSVLWFNSLGELFQPL
jgi:hypothetical protein